MNHRFSSLFPQKVLRPVISLHRSDVDVRFPYVMRAYAVSRCDVCVEQRPQVLVFAVTRLP